MSDEARLSARKRRTIAALIASPTVEDAAEVAQVARRTVHTWLNEPEFKAELRRAEDALIADAVRALVADLLANHTVMRMVRDDTEHPAAVRLRAAMALDASALRWRELGDIESRLAALEARVCEKSN